MRMEADEMVQYLVMQQQEHALQLKRVEESLQEMRAMQMLLMGATQNLQTHLANLQRTLLMLLQGGEAAGEAQVTGISLSDWPPKQPS